MTSAADYILDMVKFPDPAQPDPVPVNVQVPVMVLLLSVPCSVS